LIPKLVGALAIVAVGAAATETASR